MSHTGEFAPVALSTILLFLGLASLAAFDAQFFIIPDLCILFVAGVGLTAIGRLCLNSAIDHVLAAGLGFTLVVGLDILHSTLRGFHGIGRGDAKLLAVGGLWVGIEGLPTMILWASLSGLFSIMIMRFRQDELVSRTAIPFGPHLAAAFWLVWLFGPLTRV